MTSTLENRALLEAWERARGDMTRKEFAESYGVKPSALNGRLMRAKKERDSGTTVTGDINRLTIKTPPGRITTLDQLIKVCEVDLDIWEVERFIVNKWEVGRKGITKDLVWEHGILDGYSHDTGGINVEPLYQVKAWLIRKAPIAIEPVIQPVTLKVRKYKTPKAKKPKADLKAALIIPDLQVGFSRDLETNQLTNFHDRDYLDLVVAIARDIQPDTITLLGDNVDLAEWSDRFVRSPEFYFTTQPAINELAWWLTQLRLACPHAKIYYIEGNHEMRMERSIITHMAAAYHLKPANEKIKLPVMSIPYLLNLDALNIEWVGNYPDGMVWLNNGLKCVHGDKARSVPGGSAKAILDASEVSVIFGHIHRAEAVTRTRHTRKGSCIIKALSPGCGCRLDGVVPGHTMSQNWSQGLAVAHYDEDVYSSIDSIDVQAGKAVYLGKLYESSLDMDVIRKAVDWRGL
jgi:predicted MPP superfamily phosphohydrolase